MDLPESEFMRAVASGDLPKVQSMLREGTARISDTDDCGRTALHWSTNAPLPMLQWLLTEGGCTVSQTDNSGSTALIWAAMHGNFEVIQWLLEHGGADISNLTNRSKSVWDLLSLILKTSNMFKQMTENAKCVNLLRVMFLKGAPSPELVMRMSPEHALMAQEGARLRAALPTYLTRRRALLNVHCPLIPPLRAIVFGYFELTTTEDFWATGLGDAPVVKRPSRPVAAAPVARFRPARLLKQNKKKGNYVG
jgi:hypothetical protein